MVAKIRTFHEFSDKMPEINEYPILGMVSKNFRDLKIEAKKYLLEYIFSKLSLIFGGYHHFWQDEEDMNFLKQGWLEAMNGLNVNEILSGLYGVLKGRTAYVSRPPVAHMEFYSVCREADRKSVV